MMKRIHLLAVAALMVVVMMVPASPVQAQPIDCVDPFIPVVTPDDEVVCVDPAAEEEPAVSQGFEMRDIQAGAATPTFTVTSSPG
jgi:hypothetical protein